MWYFADNGQKQGPFDENQMVDFINNGTIKQETQVWNEDMADWMEAKATILASQFLENSQPKQIPPPIPPMPPTIPAQQGKNASPILLRKSVFQIITFLAFPLVGVFFAFVDDAIFRNIDYDNFGGAMFLALIVCAIPLAARLLANKLENAISNIAAITRIYSWVILAIAAYGAFCAVLDIKYDMCDHMVSENEDRLP